ncbi:hypothetical protein MSPP1_003722 [Malassezia sp. CBS 17886]|nr:hypothetical protein MSPP1_003722 [Malassezia sp. CBS 17886]
MGTRGVLSAPWTRGLQAPWRQGACAAALAQRVLSTGAAARQASPTAPPPNTPYHIFDRDSKVQQKTRAALRRPATADGNALADESQRGTQSRFTDYVRDAAAQDIAERIADVKQQFPTIVELGAGAGHLRHHLDVGSTGVQKLVMCDTSVEIERRVVDEELLPFEENSLDCIIASGSLHWTNDLPGALIQIQRALKPDGVFIGYMCGGDTLFELRTSFLLAEQERHGGLSVHVSPMTDTGDVSSLLTRAGFTLQTVDKDEITVNYPSMFELMRDLQDMGESNAVINRKPFLGRDTVLAAAATYQTLHGTEDHVPATYSTIYMIGWKPSPSQPKPLERGTATHSLKDAL